MDWSEIAKQNWHVKRIHWKIVKYCTTCQRIWDSKRVIKCTNAGLNTEPWWCRHEAQLTVAIAHKCLDYDKCRLKLCGSLTTDSMSSWIVRCSPQLLMVIFSMMYHRITVSNCLQEFGLRLSWAASNLFAMKTNRPHACPTILIHIPTSKYMYI